MSELLSLFTFKVVFYFTLAAIVHEFGHFVVAKFFKFKVTEFCIGIGPKLYGRKFGETEYMVRLYVPIGGHIHLDVNPNEFTSKRIAEWTLGVWFGPVLNIIVGILTHDISPLFSFINLFTGVMNLLPIPSSDGWLIMVGTYKFFQKRRYENR